MAKSKEISEQMAFLEDTFNKEHEGIYVERSFGSILTNNLQQFLELLFLASTISLVQLFKFSFASVSTSKEQSEKVT